ncbi:alpha/beta hydrolase [Luteolibacter sp. GHJ8]|uniref:Alpha/beta hydrolase n=1 Tax=Luteolibacter rhizosphaerae TaxID=2989719 RepID=A0ABT3GAC3_9BACT|nr:alpha/beta hydrolase [Luteolibacter rhizosphaerae]
MVRALFFLLILASLASARTLRDLPYAGKKSHPYQKLDLYLPDQPSKKARPVFILIHGGGWSMGDKSNKHFVEPKTSWLVDGGYIVASVNYRLAPTAKHPKQVEDVLRSITWIQKHIARHGGDPQRIYLLGHSAGAHLAALAAVDSARQKTAGIDPAAIRGVVLLDGAGYDITRQYPALREGGAMQKMYRHAFTDDPTTQRDASPVHRVTAKAPPFLILHVARRADSRLQSNLLATALREEGGKAKVLAVDKTHATINADCGKKGDPVTNAISAFLAR